MTLLAAYRLLLLVEIWRLMGSVKGNLRSQLGTACSAWKVPILLFDRVGRVSKETRFSVTVTRRRSKGLGKNLGDAETATHEGVANSVGRRVRA